MKILAKQCKYDQNWLIKMIYFELYLLIGDYWEILMGLSVKNVLGLFSNFNLQLSAKFVFDSSNRLFVYKYWNVNLFANKITNKLLSLDFAHFSCLIYSN